VDFKILGKHNAWLSSIHFQEKWKTTNILANKVAMSAGIMNWVPTEWQSKALTFVLSYSLLNASHTEVDFSFYSLTL
jgi:hypothetical protein